MSLTLQGTFDATKGLYGRRNKLHLSRNGAISLMSRALKQLIKDVRKGCKDPTYTAKLVASMLAHIYAYAGTFGELPIAEEWARKYPLMGCAYCGHKPCQCELGARKNITDYGIDPQQLNMTLTECVTHLDTLYGDNNRRNGIQMALLRLFEEIQEGIEVEAFDFLDSRLTLDGQATLIARELADAIAWTLVFMTMISPDHSLLETAFEQMYCGNCEDCHKRPCQCGSAFLKRARRPNGPRVDRRTNDFAHTTSEE